MNQKKKIERAVKARQAQIQTTFTEMIDVIEKYFLATPFDFIEGKEGECTYYCFPVPNKEFGRFYPWAEKWMCALFPEAAEVQRKLEENGDHSDEPGELAFAAQRFGFVLGVLVGAKSMGATRAQLMEKSQGFTIPAIGRAWYMAEEDAKKEQRKEQRKAFTLILGHKKDETLKGDFNA